MHDELYQAAINHAESIAEWMNIEQKSVYVTDGDTRVKIEFML